MTNIVDKPIFLYYNVADEMFAHILLLNHHVSWEKGKESKMGIAALVLGIISIIIGVFTVGVFGWAGAIVGIVGIILGAIGRNGEPEKRGIATAGMVCSIVGTILCLLFYLACAACVGVLSA